MRISARCDYACRALLELAMHWPSKEPLHLHDISDKQSIPIKYLVQILIQLKREGLVVSARGKEGGYNLAKAPNKIQLREVITLTSGPLVPISESVIKDDSIFNSIWKETEVAISEVLNRITFEDIIYKTKGLQVSLNYQI